ncbi:MAG TPA: hypothetical protein VHW74_11010 [Mycobacteriales bacterium]|jgi:hypothetical protein|nr:hypothetical protein [Mycobacteriales bacterium]
MLTEADPDAIDAGWWRDDWLNACTYTISGDATEVLRNLISERALGMPRETLA